MDRGCEAHGALDIGFKQYVDERAPLKSLLSKESYRYRPGRYPSRRTDHRRRQEAARAASLDLSSPTLPIRFPDNPLLGGADFGPRPRRLFSHLFGGRASEGFIICPFKSQL